MRKKRIGIILFIAGIVLMVAATATGKAIVEPVKDLGPTGFLAEFGGQGTLAFIVFAAGFNLGAALMMIGASLSISTPGRQFWWLVASAVLALVVVQVTALIFGTGHSPAFFGIGGVINLILIALSVWFWSRERKKIHEMHAGAADLKMIGYFFFILATWNVCGLGGIPFFGLYPEKMLTFGTLPSATGHMKMIMILFILGWLFTFLGHYRASRD